MCCMLGWHTVQVVECLPGKHEVLRCMVTEACDPRTLRWEQRLVKFKVIFCYT